MTHTNPEPQEDTMTLTLTPSTIRAIESTMRTRALAVESARSPRRIADREAAEARATEARRQYDELLTAIAASLSPK